MEKLGLRIGGSTRGRVAYATTKTWLLDAYYEFCRDRRSPLKWWRELVLRSATSRCRRTKRAPSIATSSRSS